MSVYIFLVGVMLSAGFVTLRAAVKFHQVELDKVDRLTVGVDVMFVCQLL